MTKKLLNLNIKLFKITVICLSFFSYKEDDGKSNESEKIFTSFPNEIDIPFQNLYEYIEGEVSEMQLVKSDMIFFISKGENNFFYNRFKTLRK